MTSVLYNNSNIVRERRLIINMYKDCSDDEDISHAELSSDYFSSCELFAPYQ